MKKREVRYWVDFWVASFVLFALIGCSMDTGTTQRYSEAAVKSVVSKVIDEEMDTIKENLDPDLQAGIDGGLVKDGSPLTGSQIVELTQTEEYGEDYIDFCFEVDRSSALKSADDVLEQARQMIPSSEYENLLEKVAQTEKALNGIGEEMVKGVPADQQEAFYQDLKTLVVRSVVLLTAGVVYAVMPDTVFWGKVSAAAAISVGAGMVAIAVMTIYGYFKLGIAFDAQPESFEEWFKDVLNDSKAEFALTSAVTAIGNSLGKGPVVTGIIMCAFAVFKATETITVMLKTYNFDA